MAKSYITMTFVTDNNKKASINVQNPRDDVTDEDVKGVMNSIKTSNALISSAGTFVESSSAKLTKVEETEFNIK